MFYLLLVLTGVLAGFARRGLVVSGDAAATATNIMAHQPAFQLSVAGELLLVAFNVPVAALFYELFRPVNRSIALVAAFFSLVHCAIQGLGTLGLLAPVVILRGDPYLSPFKVEELQALAFLSLKLYGQAYSIALPFFGFFCLLIGYLTFKSTFLPRILGVLIMVSGLGWLTFLSPAFGASLMPYNKATAIGEVLLALWCLVVGVNEQRWKEQAGAAEASILT